MEYSTYTAPPGSDNQRRELYSKLFGVGFAASKSAIYALSDIYQAVDNDDVHYYTNTTTQSPTNILDGYTGAIHKYEYQSDGTYNYVTATSFANILEPRDVTMTTQADVPAIVAYRYEGNCVYGLKGDLTTAWTGPNMGAYGTRLYSLDIGMRFQAEGLLNVFIGMGGLYMLPVLTSSFGLAAGAVLQRVHQDPYNGAHIGVLGSRTSVQQTIGLQIDSDNIPATWGALRYVQYEGYTSNAGSTFRNSLIIEPSVNPSTGIGRYSSDTDYAVTMEAHNGCVYALMNDDRLYMIVTGSDAVASVSTYIDGVAAVISTRSANKTVDLDGNPLPSHKVHIVTRDGRIILNPLPTKSGTKVVYNQSDIIDCRQYVGLSKSVRVVTNHRNTTNENIHLIAGPNINPSVLHDSDTIPRHYYGETVAFAVNPNTRTVSNVQHFGSVNAYQLVTHGRESDSVFATRKQYAQTLNKSYGNGLTQNQTLYSSSLQGVNPTKWYKFDI